MSAVLPCRARARSRTLRTLACLGLFVLVRAANTAETSSYVFDVLGTDAGLPQTNVALAVLQTRDGYLWIGTEGGLARFDGVRFVSYRASNTAVFRNNLVHCLHEDDRGDLWIGTERGLIRRRGATFESIAGLGDVAVKALASDRSGRLWVGTHGRGLFSYREGQLESHAREPALLSAFVLALCVDAADRLWIGFDKAEGVVWADAGRFQRLDNPARAIEGDVLAIAESPRGTMWFGTRRHRLYRWREGSLARFRSNEGLAGTQVVALRPARGGGLWVVAGDVRRVTDTGDFTVTRLPRLPSPTINALHEDREGTLWLASRDLGLVQARQMPYRTLTTAEGLPGDGIKTVSQDSAQNLWLAVQRIGIVRVAPDGTVTTFRPADGIRNADPWSVLAARDGTIWAGFSDGLSVRRGEQWSSTADYRGVLGLFEDRAGGIWLGTSSHGVLRYHDGKFSPVELGPGVKVSRGSAFAEGADGAIYIGAWDAGLIRIRDGNVTVFDRANGLPGDDVRSVYEDRDGHLWVGFRSCGLAVRDGDRWLTSHQLSEAAANHVCAITEDDQGQLWLGTPAGAMWAPKAELFEAAHGDRPVPRMRVAEMSDGHRTAAVWSGPQPIAWKAQDGSILFATRRGLLAVDPVHLPKNTVVPPVLIERAVIDGRVVEYPASLDVPAGAREIAIDYTALSFVQPGRVLFKYRLEGHDREWVEAGTRRTAFFHRLPPGRYVLRVQASNNDGVWNETGASLAVIQAPYFFETAWFKILALVVAVSLPLGIHRWRVAVLRRENEKLNRLVTERTRELELSNAAKTEFLETVSHEIRNPLHGLNGLLEQLKRERLAPDARELMESVQACARSLGRVFEDVIDHTRLEHGQIELEKNAFSLRRLLHEIARAHAWQAAQHDARLGVELGEDFEDGFIGDEKKIETIVGNFVGNALKHAPGSPVEIRAECHALAPESVELHIEVCDRGPGIPAEEQPLLFRKFVRAAAARRERVAGTGLGLATCRALAQLMGGNVGVESEPGRETVFFLRVSLRRLPADAKSVGDAVPVAGGRVLIVEDELYNQVVLRGIALELGLTPELASNAEQAEAFLDDQEFDAIFLDWELPGAKGGDIARRVRTRPGSQPIIVAMTAHDSPQIRRECVEAGMDEFLRKPYDLDQVRRRIASARERRFAAPARAETMREKKPAVDSPLDLRAFEFYARGASGQPGDAARCFAAALDREIAAVRCAHGELDSVALARAAHRMHALAGLVGARSLMDAAERLEKISPAGPAAERATCVASLLAAASALKEEICASRTG